MSRASRGTAASLRSWGRSGLIERIRAILQPEPLTPFPQEATDVGEKPPVSDGEFSGRDVERLHDLLGGPLPKPDCDTTPTVIGEMDIAQTLDVLLHLTDGGPQASVLCSECFSVGGGLFLCLHHGRRPFGD